MGLFLNFYLDFYLISSSYTFMRTSFRQSLRLKQLTDQLHTDQLVREVKLPNGGWLKAIRQALGKSLRSVAVELKISPQAVHQLEKSEAAGTISLKQLEAVSSAMGCHVVYTLVPNHGTLADTANAANEQNLKAVHHTMALEGQTVERPDKRPLL
jgi:XRE family transcriptional regulator, regulator of sulfur utilization